MTTPTPGTQAFRDAATQAAAAPAPVAAAVTDALLATARLHSLNIIKTATTDDIALRYALQTCWDDFRDLEQMLAEAGREADMTAAVAEYARRALEAGAVNRAARCTCGHSGSVAHVSRFAEGDRLPCAADGCDCDDVTYAQD